MQLLLLVTQVCGFVADGSRCILDNPRILEFSHCAGHQRTCHCEIPQQILFSHFVVLHTTLLEIGGFFFSKHVVGVSVFQKSETAS